MAKIEITLSDRQKSLIIEDNDPNFNPDAFVQAIIHAAYTKTFVKCQTTDSIYLVKGTSVESIAITEVSLNSSDMIAAEKMASKRRGRPKKQQSIQEEIITHKEVQELDLSEVMQDMQSEESIDVSQEVAETCECVSSDVSSTEQDILDEVNAWHSEVDIEEGKKNA